MHFVYIIQSQKDGSYYVGYTTNIDSRIAKHNQGGSIFTKTRRPYLLVYSMSFNSKSEALQFELKVKSWKSRVAIENLIAR
jgi:putative endonuclease